MAKHKKPKAKKRAKRRSGLTVGVKSGKRKRAKRRSGFGNPFETLKGALLTSASIRAASGLAAYVALTNNKGEELPKVKMLVPAVITGLAYAGMIPASYLPAGTQAFVDAGVDNTEFLKNIFDFKFLQTSKPRAGLTVRQIPGTQNFLPARAGLSTYTQANPLMSAMNDRNGSTYQR